MKTRIVMTLALAAMSSAAIADDNRTAYGDQVRAWVEVQKSPENKAPPRGLPGEAADRVYQRYLQSFTRPIPERFERERATSDAQR